METAPIKGGGTDPKGEARGRTPEQLAAFEDMQRMEAEYVNILAARKVAKNKAEYVSDYKINDGVQVLINGKLEFRAVRGVSAQLDGYHYRFYKSNVLGAKPNKMFWVHESKVNPVRNDG